MIELPDRLEEGEYLDVSPGAPGHSALRSHTRQHDFH